MLQRDFPREWNEFVNIHKYCQEDFNGRQFLDVGAHIGFVSLLALSWGATRVVAVEPNRLNFVKLRNILSPYPGVILLNCAASGEATMISTIDNDVHSKTLTDPNGYIPGFTLDTLSRLLREDQDAVMKVDTEGAEYDILLCSSIESIRRFSMVFLETHQTPHLTAHRARSLEYIRTYMDFNGFRGPQRGASFDVRRSW